MKKKCYGRFVMYVTLLYAPPRVKSKKTTGFTTAAGALSAMFELES